LKKDKKSLLQKVCKLKKQKNDILELHLHQIEQLKHDISKKNTELKDLEELHHSYDLPEITTFCVGKFTNEIRHTIMALVLEHGVS